MLDLVILSPDGAYALVLPALLKRPQSLGIRDVTFEVRNDPYHDSSGNIVELLRPYVGQSSRALVVRDLEGSGQEAGGAKALETELAAALQRNGWTAENSAALVLEPEIESWLRLDSAHLDALIRKLARRRKEDVGQWHEVVQTAAHANGGWLGHGKSVRPKEVYRSVLNHFGISPSNALLAELASKESLTGCSVPSFVRFREIVRGWFPLQ